VCEDASVTRQLHYQLCYGLFVFQQSTNFRDRLTFDTVTAEIKVAPIYGSQCTFLRHCAYWQVMSLSAGESQNGCVSNHNDERVSCQGERRYDEPLRLYVATSDCHSVHGVQLDYKLDVYGVMNPEELCSAASTPQPNIRTCCVAFVAFVFRVISVIGQL